PFSEINYSTWSKDMNAQLHSKALWGLVDYTETYPTAAGDEQEKWDIKAIKAAGEIMLTFEADWRVQW
ncbi:hypothetical protein EDD16DRAFT_1446682, partial [Pisolithus croceorrhizus]